MIFLKKRYTWTIYQTIWFFLKKVKARQHWIAGNSWALCKNNCNLFGSLKYESWMGCLMNTHWPSVWYLEISFFLTSKVSPYIATDYTWSCIHKRGTEYHILWCSICRRTISSGAKKKKSHETGSELLDSLSWSYFQSKAFVTICSYSVRIAMGEMVGVSKSRENQSLWNANPLI